MIELFVALTILAVVTSQLFLVFTTQKKVYVTNEFILDVQEDARLVIDLLSSEARMAGFMVPRLGAVSSVDGGNTAADVVCMSDPSVLNDTQVTGATDKFDGALITSIDSGGDLVTLTTAAEFDIDNDGDDDFAVGAGVIVSDGTNTHCGRITAVDTTTRQVDFTPVIGDPTPYVAANVRLVPAVVYEVGSSGLRRNNTVLSPEVEDLQIEYGVDANSDDIVDESDSAEWPLDSIDGSAPARVRQVRLTVVTRTTQSDPHWDGPGFPGAANRAAGARDGFRRRQFESRVLPRNML